MKTKFWLGLGLWAVSVFQGWAVEFPRTPPEKVGLSPSKLERVHHLLQETVDQGEIAGALALISRRGKVAWLETFGEMDREAGRPMREDALFRIASMTKAVTAVAVLQLWEAGHFQLDDPVERYIPEFDRVRVRGSGTDPASTVPVRRPITIRDLLRHTSGITIAGSEPEKELRHWDETGRSLQEYVETLAQVPLACQPGEKFLYSFSTDVLGYLVEVLSGEPLDDYFEAHIFRPLNLRDSGFVVPASKLDRLTHHYELKSGALVCKETAAESPFQKRAAALSGGGGWHYSYPGLVTTGYDWWCFLEMLRGLGEWNGVRVLQEETVRMMCSDHLGNIPGAFEPGTGHGLGVGVITDASQHGQQASDGTIFWAGAPHNTYYFLNFEQQLSGILLLQSGPFGHLNLMNRFLKAVHQSLDVAE